MIFDVGFSLMLGIVFVYLRIRKIIAGYQTELEASQEQEKKARQEKDELMRNMAHDLRTPLTGVMTYVDVMKLENEAYAENMKNLNFISEKVLDIRTQVDNLLDFQLPVHKDLLNWMHQWMLSIYLEITSQMCVLSL